MSLLKFYLYKNHFDPVLVLFILGFSAIPICGYFDPVTMSYLYFCWVINQKGRLLLPSVMLFLIFILGAGDWGWNNSVVVKTNQPPMHRVNKVGYIN